MRFLFKVLLLIFISLNIKCISFAQDILLNNGELINIEIKIPDATNSTNETEEKKTEELPKETKAEETEDEETENSENTETEEENSEIIENIAEENSIDDNFIMDYSLIDIIPFDPDTNLLSVISNENNFENGIKSHRHSVGIDFGTTIFATLNAPLLVNLLFKQEEKQALEGKFGFRLTYTYRLTEKIDLDATFGLYILNTYYKNSNAEYFGGTYAFPLSLGLRLYFNKKDRASGFFLLPKIGATIFSTKGTENGVQKNSTLFDFYVASEMGFRIDMSRRLGVNGGVRPFIDISLLDIGVSYSHIFRFIPLPRLAIGILF